MSHAKGSNVKDRIGEEDCGTFDRLTARSAAHQNIDTQFGSFGNVMMLAETNNSVEGWHRGFSQVFRCSSSYYLEVY